VLFFLGILFLMFVGSIAWAGSTAALLKKAHLGSKLKTIVWLFTLVQIIGLAWITLSRSGAPESSMAIPRPYLAAIFFWHVLALPVFFTSKIAAALFRIAARISSFFQDNQNGKGSQDLGGSTAEDTRREGFSRRDFFAIAAQSSPALITVASTPVSQWQLEQFRVRRLTMVTPKLPAELDGLTIAHVSDTHVGRFTRGSILERIVETTNSLDSDLVVFTGDLINFSLGDLPVGIELLKGIRARHGVFACEGNHDLMQDGFAFRDLMSRASIGLLVDEAARVVIKGRRVQLTGIPWGESPNGRGSSGYNRDVLHRSLIERVSVKNDVDAFRILLAHHPHAFDHAKDFPLTLSGHTHGGQLMLSRSIGAGPSLYRYWSGLYEKEGRSLCVSNGVGNWFPIRVGAPAEIVHLTLRAGGSEGVSKEEASRRPSA
jgi:predicted MPP superfamily phosphohydrolase